MKKIFTLIAAALMSASMFAQPATVPTVNDLDAAGYDLTSRVICLYFDEQVYYGIVWAGSYNGWSIDNPASMIHFEPLDGYQGWYACQVNDVSETVQGKPVQLKKDGSFSWDFQSGDVEAWINMAQPGTKTATISVGNNQSEANCTWPTTGAYIYEVAYFKNHNSPYVADNPKHDYTITAYLPEFCDEIAAYADSVRVMGSFDNWTDGVWMLKTLDEDYNCCWTAKLNNVEEGTEFKLRFGTDADWAVQVQLNGQDLGNEMTGETTDIVLQYDGEGYGFAAPVTRKEFSFVAGEAADSDPAMFAITWGADGSSETVKMSKKEDDIYVAEILPTVDSVVLVRCATGATDIIWDGEGMNVWNLTGNYPLFDTMYFGEWTEEGLFTLTYEPPKPVEYKYYAKNNWNGEDWTWKEMTKSGENVYTLERVVFGGTGVNINTKEEDTDAKWFDLKKMTYVNDTIQKMDTVRFDLTISQEDTVLTATLLGRPAPVARKEFVFVAGEAADSDPAMFAITWGADGSSETVKMSKKEDAIYVAEILSTVDSVVLVRCATGATEIIWDGEGMNVWNQTKNYPLFDTMYFGEWTEEGLFTLTNEPPKPAPKVDKTGIIINGRKYGFPVRLVKEVPTN